MAHEPKAAAACHAHNGVAERLDCLVACGEPGALVERLEVGQVHPTHDQGLGRVDDLGEGLFGPLAAGQAGQGI